MTAAVNGAYGSYNYQSSESRALSSITQDSYDYRDQGKLINKLTGDVSYLASYMRKMQQGIDSANQNVVQQLQSLINDFLVIIGGGGDTGFDFGDLKYVLQAIGALFGFGPGLSLPINLGQAASHFFSEYVLGLANFEEAINVIIDSALATILDIFGEIPILGQAAQGLAVFITGLRDGINTTIDNLGDLISDLWNNPVQVISNLLAAMIPGLDASKILTGQFAQSMINGLTTTLTNINNFIQDVVDKIIGALTGIPIIGGAIAALVNGFESLFNGLFGQPTPKATIASAAVPSLDASKVTTGTLAATTIPNLDGAKITTGSVAADRIAALDAAKITTGSFGGARITDGAISNLKLGTDISGDKIVAGTVTAARVGVLDASKITTGDFAQTRVTGLTTDLSVIDEALETGTNLVTDPSFENANFDSLRTPMFAGSTWSYNTNIGKVRSGARSLKCVSNAGYAQLMMTPSIRSAGYMPVRPGQVFYASMWVFAETTNTGTGLVEQYLEFSTTAPGVGINYVNVGSLSGYTKGTWVQVSKYGTVPANARWMRLYACGVRLGNNSGDTLYFDDIELYEVTEANKINKALYGASADIPAATVVAAAVPSLDASKVTTGQLAEARIVDLSAAKITSGSLADARIPNLATSKITSGTFGSGFITDGAVSNVKLGTDISGDKIVAGTVVAGRVGALDASKITTGTLGTAIIPTLDQAKITNLTTDLSSITTGSSNTINYLYDVFDGTTGNTGKTITDMRTRGATVRSSAVAGESKSTALNTALYNSQTVGATILAGVVPSLDATKITTGQLAEARIVDLSAAKITSGSLADARIPNLAAGKITSGTFGAGFITDGAISNVKLGTDISGDKIAAGTVVAARVGVLDASKITTGTVADAQLGPIRDLVNGQINSGPNLIPNASFERLGFLSNNLFVTEQKRTGTRSLKLTSNGVNYASHGMFSDNVSSFTVPVAPNDVYYYEIWYRGHANNLRHRQLQVNATGGTFTITVGANTTTNIAFNATAATVQAALVALASVGAGNATVTRTNINVSPGLTMVFGASVTGAISVTTTLLTGGGINLFNNNIFMQATSYNQDGTATGYPSVAATTADDDNGVWKKLSGYLTIPAGTVPLPTVTADFRLYVNYPMPNGTIYYFDDAFLARVTEANQINKALYGASANVPASTVVAAAVPSLDATKITTGQLAEARIVDLSAAKITSGSLADARIPSLDAAKITTGSFVDARIPSLDAAKVTTGSFVDARIPNLDGAKITTGSVVAARVGALDAAKITTGTFGAGFITDGAIGNIKLGTDISGNKIAAGTVGAGFIAALDAAKITTGTFANAMIASGLDAAKLTTGTLPVARIGSGAITNVKLGADIDGSKIGAGTVIAARIGALDGSKITTGTIGTAIVPSLPQSKITGLPTDITVDSTLIEHAADLAELKASRDVSVNQGKTISVSFVQQANSASLPTTGNQQWATSYLSGSGPTFGINGGKAAWVGTLSDRVARVIYLGNGVAGNETTLTDYQVLRGVLADPPTLGGSSSSRFIALARVASADSNSYVWARAYWSGLSLLGQIGCTVNGVETIWQNNVALTWSTELSFKLGIDGNPRSYQVFSGSTLVTSYNEGYANLAAFPASPTFSANGTGSVAGITNRLFVDSSRNRRLVVTGTAGTFTLTVGANTTTAIAWNATAATVQAALVALASVGAGNATVTGTNTASPGLQITLGSAVDSSFGLAVTSTITGGAAILTDRFRWSGSAYTPVTSTANADLASSLGSGFRRFGAIVAVSGGKTSGTISSVAVSDNPPVIYAGSVARMSRASTGTVNFPTADTGLTSFFDTLNFESLDIDGNLTNGTFTVTQSKMYIVTARIRTTDVIDALASVNLQRWNGSTWSTVQRGVMDWRIDAGFLFNAYPNGGMAGASLSGTWLQYLNAGDVIRLSTQRAGGSGNVLTGTANGAETYFSISALG